MHVLYLTIRPLIRKSKTSIFLQSKISKPYTKQFRSGNKKQGGGNRARNTYLHRVYVSERELGIMFFFLFRLIFLVQWYFLICT